MTSLPHWRTNLFIIFLLHQLLVFHRSISGSRLFKRFISPITILTPFHLLTDISFREKTGFKSLHYTVAQFKNRWPRRPAWFNWPRYAYVNSTKLRSDAHKHLTSKRGALSSPAGEECFDSPIWSCIRSNLSFAADLGGYILGGHIRGTTVTVRV